MADMHSDEVPVGEKHKQAITTIGIVGLDYCGSTLINNILSGLPGCIGAGETHWIKDSQNHQNQSGRCTECYNAECPVFSEKLVKNLQIMEITADGKWWREISKSSGCKIVISADKRPRHYDRFGVPDKLLFIVKDPRAHIVSWANRKFLQPDQNLESYNQGETTLKLDEKQFDEAFLTWLRETRKHISWCIEAKKDFAVISLDYFVSNAEQMLENIAKWMDAPFDNKALEYWNTDLHYIGSNHSVKRIRENRYFFKEVKKDKRWQKVLTQEQSNSIISHDKVNYQLNRLKPFLIGELEFLE